MPDLTQYFPITNPSLIFLLVLVIILLAPIIMGKLRIPHIIGMVLAGVAIGQYGFNILVRDDSFELFGRVGLYYIMFLAALEMDVEGVKKNKGKLSLFGLLTFAVPFTLTFIMSEWLLGYPTIASLLLGCLMASNTLIAYPIVGRYGLQRKPSVTLSVFSALGTAEGVSERGVYYPLSGATLIGTFPLGVSNRFLPGESAEISVGRGTLLVFFEGNILPRFS